MQLLSFDDRAASFGDAATRSVHVVVHRCRADEGSPLSTDMSEAEWLRWLLLVGAAGKMRAALKYYAYGWGNQAMGHRARVALAAADGTTDDTMAQNVEDMLTDTQCTGAQQ